MLGAVACSTLQAADRESLEARQVHGCFCAHPLMAALLHIDAAEDARLCDGLRQRIPTPIPGAVRASTRIGTTAADCDRLVAAVAAIAADGSRWTSESSPDGTDCRPVPDPRRLILCHLL